MKRLNKVTAQVLVSFLAALFIEIVGLIVIAVSVGHVYKYYKTLVIEGTQNTLYMDKLHRLVMQEQLVSSLYVLSTSDELLDEYGRKEEIIRTQLTRLLGEFGKRMRGNEKEQIFHNINSGTYSVFSEISIAMTLRSSGAKQIAEQYISKNLTKSYDELNMNLEDLGSYINSEMDKANVFMKSYAKITGFSIVITFTVIIIFLVAVIVICLKLTSQLENNKIFLQNEVDRKTEQLVSQNNKMIYIQEQTIFGMASLIESRDIETGEHVKRTSLYVEILVRAALEAGYHPELIDEQYVELLKKAAPMHDVGKITLSDVVLRKTGRLTGEEYEQVKNHTVAGEQVIGEVLGKIESEEYVKLAMEVAKSHHEWWDGSGYPEKLKGEEIPVSARIMAIADVFDALVSPRCYKDAYSSEEAFGLIKQASGTHFDPVLVNLFISKKFDVLKVLSEN